MWFYLLLFCAAALLYLWHTSNSLPDNVVERNKARFFDALLKITVALPRYILLKIDPKWNIYYQRFHLDVFAKLQPKSPEENFVTRVQTKFDGIDVVVYVPKERKSNGAVIFIHGGGWIMGSTETTDCCTLQLAYHAGIVVASINYRLAPEHPFPAGLDDCATATIHFLAEAHRDYAVDPAKIGIMGESSGANLAAVVALRLDRRRDLSPLKFQILVYPPMQLVDFKSPSYQQHHKRLSGTALFLSPDIMIEFYLNYFGLEVTEKIVHDMSVNFHVTISERAAEKWKYVDHDILPEKSKKKENYDWPMYLPGKLELNEKLKPYLFNPEVSPLFADDSSLQNMPPTLMVTVAYDVLRDDSFWYCERLRTNGVDVQQKHYENGLHGQLLFGVISKLSMRMRREIADYVILNMR